MALIHKKIFCTLAALAAGSAAFSQRLWEPADNAIAVQPKASPVYRELLDFSTYTLNISQMKAELSRVPREELQGWGWTSQLQLPLPDGRIQRFRIVSTPIVTGAAKAKMPDFQTFAGQGIDDPHSLVRVDISSYGFHAMILSPEGDVLIDPVSSRDLGHYVSFYKRDFTGPSLFRCTTKEPRMRGMGGIDIFPAAVTTLKTYRLAMNTTGEYTTFFGGVAPAQAAVGTAVNRVTGVYERDLGIRLNMTFLNCYPNGGTDPFTNNNGVTMLSQNQTVCDASPGNANYDIGHVFSTGGGGVAGLQVVGVTGQKARGVTGLPSPVGDPFYIDYVAHEMGHQFGGNHSFNGTTGSCGGGNRAAISAYEPGSGSTIMAYAGICGAEDVQPNSDAYFHTRNYDEIISWRNNAGSGGSSNNTTNNAPTVNAGADFTIPQGTPFRLTAAGADPDGDPLTYCWEQFNLGAASPPVSMASGPIFRSRNPLTSNTRFLPQLSTVLANGMDPWEVLPTVNRNLTWRCTVRDNRVNGGGSAYDTMSITVSGSPFVVTAPNTPVTWSAGSNQTVTWTVGGGSVSPNVNILLSTDGGNSYGAGTATVLLANTPNDGSQTVTIPPTVNSTQCRIIVEASTSIFYDVSNTNFTVQPGPIDVIPDAISVLEGLFFAGGVPEVQVSDDVRHITQRYKSPAAGEHVQVQIEGTSTRFTTSQITIRVEGHTSISNLVQNIYAYNFTSNTWVNIDTITTTNTDVVRTINITTSPSQFIQTGTGKVRVKVGWLEPDPNVPRWFGRLDQVRWTINP